MTLIHIVLLGIFVLVSSFLLTAWLRRYALAHSLLDVPTHRSSHSGVIPKGGGLSIVIVFLLGIVFLFLSGVIERDVFIALIGGGVIVALVGWWDDYGHVAVPIRLLSHFLAAGWVLYWLGGVPALDLGIVEWEWKVWGNIIGLFAFVWLINLYNFMDGIDGLAATEAIVVAVCSGVLLYLCKAFGLAGALGIFAAATAGFLVWNWPPARIFMGDVGSSFLGFVMGVFILVSMKQKAVLFWHWLILLGVFVVDSLVTLLRRIVRGSRWNQAHRRHAYQHTARRWGHRRVTVGIAIVNIVWLAPLALSVYRWPQAAVALSLAALAPLIAMAFYFKAGEKPS